MALIKYLQPPSQFSSKKRGDKAALNQLLIIILIIKEYTTRRAIKSREPHVGDN